MKTNYELSEMLMKKGSINGNPSCEYLLKPDNFKDIASFIWRIKAAWNVLTGRCCPIIWHYQSEIKL